MPSASSEETKKDYGKGGTLQGLDTKSMKNMRLGASLREHIRAHSENISQASNGSLGYRPQWNFKFSIDQSLLCISKTIILSLLPYYAVGMEGLVSLIQNHERRRAMFSLTQRILYDPNIEADHWMGLLCFLCWRVNECIFSGRNQIYLNNINLKDRVWQTCCSQSICCLFLGKYDTSPLPAVRPGQRNFLLSMKHY